jgi:hypothetical protein
VVRAARTYPAVLPLLERGEMNLTTVRVLASTLTPENHAALLNAARGKTKEEVMMIVAAVRPVPDVPAITRRLPPPRPQARSLDLMASPPGREPSRDGSRHPQGPGRGETRGVRPGPGKLRLRRRKRAPLWLTEAHRVPPPE